MYRSKNNTNAISSLSSLLDRIGPQFGYGTDGAFRRGQGEVKCTISITFHEHGLLVVLTGLTDAHSLSGTISRMRK